jgi:hypothetical protein
MKKNIVLFPLFSLLIVIGIVACNPTVSPPAPLPTALGVITYYPWTIQSIQFLKADGTDSVNYSSTDLGASRLYFSTNGTCQFSDLTHTNWVGPNNDSTIFRYFNIGGWGFDQNWASQVNAGNPNAPADSLLFQASDGSYLIGQLFRCAINELDSLHFQFTYLDTSIVNTNTTPQTKYSFWKVVTLAPASN